MKTGALLSRLLRSAGIGTTTLASVILFSACAAPVRFATSAEIKQALAPSPAAQQSTQLAPQASPTSPGSGSSPAPANSSSAAAPNGSGFLAQMQAEIRQLIDTVTPSVVQIDTASGLGSGIIVDSGGDIVTNAHVVSGATSFQVTTTDGHVYPARLVGSYAGNDLAVIKVSGASGLRPAVFADSTKARAGDIVLAIGSPLGLTDSVSEGIISAVGRTQSEGNGVNLTNLIQVTAAINPGNSGGALVDINGQVVGMPTLATGSGRGGAATNIAFAIPSNQVTNAFKQLTSGSGVTHTNQPYMGVSVSSGTTPGAHIDSVVAGSPAASAGLAAGWVITSLGGHAVSNADELTQLLATHKPDDRITVGVELPDGSARSVTVTLGERPSNP
ncbi:MAG: S1C family serine protease [Candidatus Dormibacteria bacterium]